MLVDLDYYTILQLKPGSSAEEVRDQWRRLAKAYHPDKNAGDPRYVEQLKLINLAYEVLRDPKQKAAYDLRYQPGPEPVKPAPKPAASPPPRPPASPRQPVSGMPGAAPPKLPVVPVFRRKRSALALAAAAAVILLFIAWQLFSSQGGPVTPTLVVGPMSAGSPPPSGGASGKPPIDSDSDKAIIAQHTQEANQLAALKAPLLDRYQTALPQTNALIAQSDSAVASARNNSALETDSSQSEQLGMVVRLSSETGQLRAVRDRVKSGLDAMQWYDTASMWSSQALEVANDLQQMETLQQAVSRDMGALSHPSQVIGSPASHSLSPGFQGDPDFSAPASSPPQ